VNSRIKSEYIKGVADTSDGLTIVLDVLKVLSDDEIAVVKDSSSVAAETVAEQNTQNQ
jgi:chemotaxis signal transduction protein